MKAREIMTANPACCTPEAPVREAAELMETYDCGCIPVVSDQGSMRLVGVITDRDLAVRGVAHDRGPETPVRELMTRNVLCCSPESDLAEAERLMAEHQVRRVPVVDDRACCVGMIAQADLAREAENHRIGEEEVVRVVERISEPSR